MQAASSSWCRATLGFFSLRSGSQATVKGNPVQAACKTLLRSLNLVAPSQPRRLLGFLGLSGGVHLPPLKVKLLAGDLGQPSSQRTLIPDRCSAFPALNCGWWMGCALRGSCDASKGTSNVLGKCVKVCQSKSKPCLLHVTF